MTNFITNSGVSNLKNRLSELILKKYRSQFYTQRTLKYVADKIKAKQLSLFFYNYIIQVKLKNMKIKLTN